MPIKFTCTYCDQQIEVSRQQAGQEVYCSKCKQPVQAPSLAGHSAPPPAVAPESIEPSSADAPALKTEPKRAITGRIATTLHRPTNKSLYMV